MTPRTILIAVSGLLGLASLQLPSPSACVAAAAPTALPTPRIRPAHRPRSSPSPYAILTTPSGGCRAVTAEAPPCDDASTEATLDERPRLWTVTPGLITP